MVPLADVLLGDGEGAAPLALAEDVSSAGMGAEGGGDVSDVSLSAPSSLSAAVDVDRLLDEDGVAAPSPWLCDWD